MGVRPYRCRARNLGRASGNAVEVIVRELDDADRPWLCDLIGSEWGLPVVSISGTHDPSALPGYVAEDGGRRVGVITYRLDDRGCEVVTLHSLRERQGVGTTLLAAARGVADAASARLWLITTDANENAIGFYERRGMSVRAVHPNFADEVRRFKPQVGGGGSRAQFRDAIEYSY
jgi:ribosomal protein S18 acetylase RimI-like enzyme